MSFKNSLRDRALKAFNKMYGLNCDLTDVRITKARSKKTLTVRTWYGRSIFTWSYKNGGKLEKVA